MRILAISGSLQAQSKNLALLTAAATVAPPGVDVVLFDGIRDLPHFNPDIEAMAAPQSVLRFGRRSRIATPSSSLRPSTPSACLVF